MRCPKCRRILQWANASSVPAKLNLPVSISGALGFRDYWVLTSRVSISAAAIRISTKNHDVLNAVHDFLTFQIEDHHTGDEIE
jgi:hypothetical protein